MQRLTLIAAIAAITVSPALAQTDSTSPAPAASGSAMHGAMHDSMHGAMHGAMKDKKMKGHSMKSGSMMSHDHMAKPSPAAS